jgi:hypothetical protein
MFVLPAIALPFLLMLAVYRLLRIPRQLRAGALQVPVRRRAMLLGATAVAYLALLAYTVALLAALVHTLLFLQQTACPPTWNWQPTRWPTPWSTSQRPGPSTTG